MSYLEYAQIARSGPNSMTRDIEGISNIFLEIKWLSILCDTPTSKLWQVFFCNTCITGYVSGTFPLVLHSYEVEGASSAYTPCTWKKVKVWKFFIPKKLSDVTEMDFWCQNNLQVSTNAVCLPDVDSWNGLLV